MKERGAQGGAGGGGTWRDRMCQSTCFKQAMPRGGLWLPCCPHAASMMQKTVGTGALRTKRPRQIEPEPAPYAPRGRWLLPPPTCPTTPSRVRTRTRPRARRPTRMQARPPPRPPRPYPPGSAMMQTALGLPPPAAVPSRLPPPWPWPAITSSATARTSSSRPGQQGNAKGGGLGRSIQVRTDGQQGGSGVG